jgi:putative membrane protein
MDYHLLLGLHMGAVGIWIGGMLLSSIAIYIASLTTKTADPSADRLGLVLCWNRWITTPAMIVVWGLGLAMTMQIGWYMFVWFKLKIIFVLLLSALHGKQSATLRRINRGTAGNIATPVLRLSAPIVVVATIAIIVLVIAKPFGV